MCVENQSLGTPAVLEILPQKGKKYILFILFLSKIAIIVLKVLRLKYFYEKHRNDGVSSLFFLEIYLFFKLTLLIRQHIPLKPPSTNSFGNKHFFFSIQTHLQFKWGYDICSFRYFSHQNLTNPYAPALFCDFTTLISNHLISTYQQASTFTNSFLLSIRKSQPYLNCQKSLNNFPKYSSFIDTILHDVTVSVNSNKGSSKLTIQLTLSFKYLFALPYDFKSNCYRFVFKIQIFFVFV